MSTNKETHNCPHCARSGEGSVEGGQGLIKGWRLGLASACVFLLPLIAALIGSVLFVELELSEVLGAVVGFAGGLLLAIGSVRFFRK